MTDNFSGDPKLCLNIDGSRLTFRGGQSVMDQGLENLALISLFTSPDWSGNILFLDVNKKIGSDFETVAKQPITITSLNDVRQAAERALINPAFGKVTVEVFNPESYRLNVLITIEPPGQDVQTLLLTRHGENWLLQSSNPAYPKVAPCGTFKQSFIVESVFQDTEDHIFQDTDDSEWIDS